MSELIWESASCSQCIFNFIKKLFLHQAACVFKWRLWDCDTKCTAATTGCTDQARCLMENKITASLKKKKRKEKETVTVHLFECPIRMFAEPGPLSSSMSWLTTVDKRPDQHPRMKSYFIYLKQHSGTFAICSSVGAPKDVEVCCFYNTVQDLLLFGLLLGQSFSLSSLLSQVSSELLQIKGEVLKWSFTVAPHQALHSVSSLTMAISKLFQPKIAWDDDGITNPMTFCTDQPIKMHTFSPSLPLLFWRVFNTHKSYY